jgi:hypothetical protein
MDDAATGIALSRAYFDDVVEPILADRFPGLAYSAGRLGTGSDVLRLDDATSRDHDWGLRLTVLLTDDAPEPDSSAAVSAELDRMLPDSFRGLPTRFAFTGETESRHHIDVDSISHFLSSRLGFDPRNGMGTEEWLSLSGQSVLEVTAGAVFVDRAGRLEETRRALTWYPRDLWLYVLACDWLRIAQELPLMGRAADVGDDTGSRIIAARLAHAVMHLTFLLEQRWAPYAKWYGSLFSQLPLASAVGPAVDLILTARTLEERQDATAAALQTLLNRQHALALSSVARATVPFWDRPYLHPDPSIAAELLGAVRDPDVRTLPAGRGSVEQRTDNVDVLVDPAARLAAVRMRDL